MNYLQNTLLDNSCTELSMVAAISSLLDNPACNHLCIATGYWDLPGTALLLPALSRFLQRPGTDVRLLIGLNPTVRVHDLAHPQRSVKEYIRRDIEQLEVTQPLVDTLSLIKQYCLADFNASRIQIKSFEGERRKPGEGIFHAKTYIFLGQGQSQAILGSSNFTQKGLQGNTELNYLEANGMIVTAKPSEHSEAKGYEQWFNEQWERADEWNKIFLEEVLHGTPIDVQTAPLPLTPYELYIKMLDHRFHDLLSGDLRTALEHYLPADYTALDYQLQAVQQCLAIMQAHGGFMLADVVGLGKTIVGTLILKHFLTAPRSDLRPQRALIVVPPAIRRAWEDTIQLFDRKPGATPMAPNIEFITTGSIRHLLPPDVDCDDDDALDTGDFAAPLPTSDYGLILIDESHKFRSATTNMYRALDQLIQDIAARTTYTPYIALLTATPQNNRPDDLKNQIYLFERTHAQSTLRKALGGNLEGYFANVNRQYDALIRHTDDETPDERRQRREQLKQLSADIRNRVLSDILVRRTRTDIQRYYPESHLRFPAVEGPIGLQYTMAPRLAQLFQDTVDTIFPTPEQIESQAQDYLQYYRYRAIEFLADPERKDLYKGGNIDPDRFSRQLARIMQLNLVKRLESSLPAFRASLRNLRQYTQNMIEMWDHDALFVCPELNVNAIFAQEPNFDLAAQRLRESIRRLDADRRNTKQRNQELRQADFLPTYRQLLQADLDRLDHLCTRWDQETDDPKHNEFRRALTHELLDPAHNPEQKLVIFSEAIDTVQQIEQTIREARPDLRTLVVTAANRAEQAPLIRANFDANCPAQEQRHDFSIIVTTEVLAEGINLHRAATILNYDTPWNATRLMQRIGRVNRIGTQAQRIRVFNFMPSANGDHMLGLVEKAYTKLQSFHTLFGEDAKVFTDDEELVTHDLQHLVDGEESVDERYIAELKAYRDANPQRFREIREATDGLQLAATPSADAPTCFLVTGPDHPQGLYVDVAPDLQPTILYGEQAYEAFRCLPATPAQALPGNIDERQQAAIEAFRGEVNRINAGRRKGKQEEAQKLIADLSQVPDITRDTARTLALAMQRVRHLDVDIIRATLRLKGLLDHTDAFLAHSVDEAVARHLAPRLQQAAPQKAAPQALFSTTHA